MHGIRNILHCDVSYMKDV